MIHNSEWINSIKGKKNGVLWSSWGLYFPPLSNIFPVKVTTIVEYEDAKHTSAKKISKKVSLS